MSEDRSETRAKRVLLRRMMSHLQQAHLNLGAQLESPGFAEVIYHPDNSLPALNYVTPRRQTAWVPDNALKEGLSVLAEQGRRGRIHYADGLFLPEFKQNLANLGLEEEEQYTLMTFQKDTTPLPDISPDPDLNLVQVNGAQGMSIWWYVWRNAYYDVITSSAEPLMLGQDLRAIHRGEQLDLILYRYGFPVGVVRLTLHDGSAHLNSYALLKEISTLQLEQRLRLVAIQAALDAGCDLIFSMCVDDAACQPYCDLGFVDRGHLLCYAEPTTVDKQKNPDDDLAQSVLIL